METGELLNCPFCDFTDHDHLFLLQHVETLHPEGGRHSPFAVREELTRQGESPAGEMEGARDSCSAYIECQCGEFCLLTEFENHLEMHYAEGMGFEETSRATVDAAALRSALHSGQASSPQMELPSPTLVPIVTSGPSRPVPIRSVVERPQRTTNRKSGSAVRDFIDVLRHSTSPPSRKPSQAARNRPPRRLGVRESNSTTCVHRLLTIPLES